MDLAAYTDLMLSEKLYIYILYIFHFLKCLLTHLKANFSFADIVLRSVMMNQTGGQCRLLRNVKMEGGSSSAAVEAALAP